MDVMSTTRARITPAHGPHHRPDRFTLEMVDEVVVSCRYGEIHRYDQNHQYHRNHQQHVPDKEIP